MCSANSTQHLIILDMDNAMGMPVRDPDDGLALALALSSPELKVLGCTTTSGNCRTKDATTCTCTLLAAAGRTEIPVIQGAEEPLQADRDAHHALLDSKAAGKGSHYWEQPSPGSATSPSDSLVPPKDVSAHTFLIETIRKYPHQITLVMLGGFTNLALALTEAPDIAPLIKEVVHMGGAFTPASQNERSFVWQTPDLPETAWQTLRFNTWHDPEATAIVLQANIPLRFISANVTVHAYLREEALNTICDTLKSSASHEWYSFFTKGTVPWFQWSINERQLAGAHMHDPLTVACVFAPELCRYETMHVDAEAFLHDEEWLMRTASTTTRKVQVAVDIDDKEFEKLLTKRLATPPLPPFSQK